MPDPKYKVGDKVYVTDQFKTINQCTIKTVHDGCDCCDLYRGKLWFYNFEEQEIFDSEGYVHATIEEAEASLKHWQEFRNHTKVFSYMRKQKTVFFTIHKKPDGEWRQWWNPKDLGSGGSGNMSEHAALQKILKADRVVRKEEENMTIYRLEFTKGEADADQA